MKASASTMGLYFLRRPLHWVPALFVLLPALGCVSTRERATVVDVSSGQTVAVGKPESLEMAGGEVAGGEEAEDVAGGVSTWSGNPIGAKDKDGDGVVDAADKCPAEPEDRDGFQDADGCPEFDNDADGIADASDKCPNAPETMNGFEDDDGCPDASLDRAKRAYRDGATAFAQGDYAMARKHFEDAFNIEPRDALLYNIAVTAEKQGDRNAACRYYRQWRGTAHGVSSANRNPSLESCP